MLKVLCFDPGVTTGIGSGLLDDGYMEVGSAQEKMEVWDLWDYLHEHKPDILIYERFEHRNRARSGLVYFSRELIGIMRLYGNKHPQVELADRMPGQDWAYYNDKELKRTNVYKPGKPHAMDATRHLLGWYTFGAGYRFNSRGYGPA